MQKYYWLVCALLLLTTVVSAQKQAKGYSRPGRLSKPGSIDDTEAPNITLTETAGVVVAKNRGLRAIKVVPNTTNKGMIIFRGVITDNGTVASLQINNQNVPLVGSLRKKEFALRLKAPPVGMSRKLILIARDMTGNTTRQTYQISASSAARAPSLALLDTQTELIKQPTVASNVPANVEAVSLATAEFWALVIGVSDYPHPSLNELTYPVRDAQQISSVLTTHYIFEPNNVRELLNPTREELIGALSEYTADGATPLGENDNILIFYAGHGYWDENYREGYWLPSDAEQYNRAKWVSNSDIQRVFQAIKAKHILLLSDACFSGSMFASRSPFSKAIEEAYKVPSRKAITAGNLSEVPDLSVFKEYLVKKLEENTDRFLDAGTLYNLIKQPVANNSPIQQRPLYGTIQQTGDEGGEFIFVRRY